MMNYENPLQHLSKFFLYIVGIGFLLFCFTCLFFGSLAFGGDVDFVAPGLFFTGISLLAKNLLTYKALYSSKAIKDFENNKVLMIPFILLDLIVGLGLFLSMRDDSADDIFLLIYLFLLSTTFAILSLRAITKLKKMKLTQKQKNILLISIKVFSLCFYFLMFPFVVCNIINPIGGKYIIVVCILMLFFTFFAVIIENIFSILLFIYFGVFKDITLELKKKFLLGGLIEFIILFIIFMSSFQWMIASFTTNNN